MANHRLILGVEAKQAMSSNPKTNEKQAREAAEQVKKREKYIKNTYGHLLGKGWRYVRVICLYDHQGSPVRNKCSHCSPFILTNGTETEEKVQMDDLMTALTTGTLGANTLPHTGNTDFHHVFSRIVGLTALFMKVQKVSSYHNIMGTNETDINAGWTPASKLAFGHENDLLRYGDMVGRPHDIYQLIFFNPDQIGLLALDTKLAVFVDDYGAGKCYVCAKT